MSTTPKTENVKLSPMVRRRTAKDIAARKSGEPIVCLTAYITPMAARLDDYCDLLLVGDSLGMVLYGMDNTLGVTLDMMIQHGRAVMRGAKKALVVIDMPFGSYEESKEQAFRNCAKVLSETGAGAVKLEGGIEMAETIAFLVKRGIPVLGHVGLMPQSVNSYGGYGAHGRTENEWQPILDDAQAIAAAGAFATVLEGVAAPLADKITEKTSNPIIGIGASNKCDGQILVTEDMLGLFSFNPKFVKRYMELGTEIVASVEAYASEVRARTFPSDEYTYKMKD
ncbi:3-methyl-2-oxobutanoate hydroxymethyltransferase [Temperatibacter marinus]|uniref:3-methyl-2-oxobutanoate hydroxymethyltransferase n=1 Tax=Temperatibacter marinus TaxID=1456591 RepID=A0AA52ECI2_9PROT|nr:3-methyl-2-oxobutanoate hydroxymethyltransferase [Temperatibacter marinus]WND02190.1 3-methyl-2-oxobutanoate hydroxymethyltransferase [Temperatibacter marinus]